MRKNLENHYRYLVFSILCFIICIHLSAQTIGSKSTPGTLNLGGGTSKIAQNFTVDWSIGESTVIESFFGKNTVQNLLITSKSFVTSGVLQPIDWFHLPIINAQALRLDEVRLYPVPAKNSINIDFRSADIGYLYVSLYENTGNLIATKELVKSEKPIMQNWNIASLPSGSYFFRVLVRPNSYQIQKTGVFNFQKIN
jgi:hypothetical protein